MSSPVVRDASVINIADNQSNVYITDNNNSNYQCDIMHTIVCILLTVI